MSALFKAGQPKVIPEFTGLQVNTAVQVLPIPIIYGCPRCSINLIYYNGFEAKKVDVGGKGILSGGKGGQEIEYFATIILALGEGQTGDILVIYQDQGVYTPADYPSPGANYFSGGEQTAWSYITTNWPADARPYPFLSYVGIANAELDASATVPQINVVPVGLFARTCPLNNSTITITTGQYDQNGNPISFLGNIALGDADADPAQVIYDFLTNTRYGAGFPSALIDPNIFSSTDATNLSVGDSALQTYCQAVGIGWSTILANVESANGILDRWTKNMSVATVWTGELLKFIPYWDEATQENPGYDPSNPLGIQPKYFVPNTDFLLGFTMDQILHAKEQGGEPITYSLTDPMTVFNTVRVDYRDRTNFFNDNVVEAKDEAHAELFGPRVDNIGLANEYTLAAYANVAAQMRLRRNISIRRRFTFRLGPLFAFLDPMDIIRIPDPSDWNSTVLVRIISCEDDEDEITTYVAEEFLQGAASPTFIPTSSTTPPNQGATNVPSSSVFTPVIFEPTPDMLTATGFASPQVIIGASGGTNGILDPNWGGCVIWISLDDVNYEQIGVLSGPSGIGYLSQTLLAYAGTNPDNTNTLEVNMTESDTALPSFGSLSEAAALGKSLCVVIGSGTLELLTYENSTLLFGNTFALTGLYRGQYGTTSQTFANGSQFLFMGTSTFFETALPPQYVGKTFYVKLQSFNVFNNAIQDLADCVAYQYLVNGGVPPLSAVYPARPMRPFSRINLPQRKSFVRSIR